MGRLTTLKKPQGGITGIVVSDVFRRIIARTIAKQCAEAAEKATAQVEGRAQVSHNAMLKGLLTMEGGDRVLPFVRLYYGDTPIFLWENDLGGVHSVLQGEGGEQRDPLMPMLFSLGQHAALMAVAARLREGERLLAFLDDLYMVTSPDRTVEA